MKEWQKKREKKGLKWVAWSLFCLWLFYNVFEYFASQLPIVSLALVYALSLTHFLRQKKKKKKENSTQKGSWRQCDTIKVAFVFVDLLYFFLLWNKEIQVEKRF